MPPQLEKRREFRTEGRDVRQTPARWGTFHGGTSYLGFEEEEDISDGDFDIDELIKCDNIENTPFLKTSQKLMATVESMISQIDDRLRYKKHGAIPSRVAPAVGRGLQHMNTSTAS